ncbi:acylphosphatase [Enterococcus olivae]
MRKVRMNVNGRVQGVGFRITTKMLADELGIYGSAKNEHDGSVTIEAMGEDTPMESFIQKVKSSPSPVGRVTKFDIEEDASITERKNFTTD